MAPANQTPVALALASAAVGDVVHGIAPDQWGAPTPCTQWPVRRVVGHLAGMNLVFAALLAGQPMPARTDMPDEELPKRYDASAELLISRFSEPGALERVVDSPMGSATGAERLEIRLYDLLAHGWDVARATGQVFKLPEDLVEESLVFATAQLDGVDREGRFAPAQPCPDDAPALDRLVAFLGRDLAWEPARGN